MKTRKTALKLGLLLPLTAYACTGGLVGWGGTYDIIYADQNRVTMTYDAVVARHSEMLAAANRHCAKYGKHAEPDNMIITSPLGQVRTYMYRREGPKVGSGEQEIAVEAHPAPTQPKPSVERTADDEYNDRIREEQSRFEH